MEDRAFKMRADVSQARWDLNRLRRASVSAMFFLTKSVIWKEAAIYLNGHEEQVILYKVEASQSRQAS